MVLSLSRFLSPSPQRARKISPPTLSDSPSPPPSSLSLPLSLSISLSFSLHLSSYFLPPSPCPSLAVHFYRKIAFCGCTSWEKPINYAFLSGSRPGLSQNLSLPHLRQTPAPPSCQRPRAPCQRRRRRSPCTQRLRERVPKK